MKQWLLLRSDRDKPIDHGKEMSSFTYCLFERFDHSTAPMSVNGWGCHSDYNKAELIDPSRVGWMRGHYGEKMCSVSIGE